jgi:hypothetical protein
MVSPLTWPCWELTRVGGGGVAEGAELAGATAGVEVFMSVFGQQEGFKVELTPENPTALMKLLPEIVPSLIVFMR